MKYQKLRTYLQYYLVIMLFTFVTSLPIDILINDYAQAYEFDGFYFFFNFMVYSLMTVSSMFLASLFNSKYFYKCNVLRVITEFFTVIIIVNIIQFICNYVFYKPVPLMRYIDNGLIESKAMLGSCIQGLLIMIITEMIYLYRMKKQNEIEKEKFRYLQLKAQLNPHFLFNCFNAITSMGYTQNGKEIASYTSSLADIYRYILNNENQDVVTVKDECGFIEDYYKVLKKRYADNLTVQLSIDTQVQNKKMLFLTLQLLVENAVKHNAVSKETPLNIIIYNDSENIIAKNNINKKQTENAVKSGVGLTNLNQRYMMLAKKGITVQRDEKTFKVTVPLI